MAATARAIAYVDAGAVERNCALLKETAWRRRAVRGREGGRVRPRCHRRARPPRSPAARRGSRSRRRTRRRNCVATASGSGILVMGALTHAELELALEADADVVAWREGFARAAAALASADRPARLHVKLDTGMGRLGTHDPARGAAASRRSRESADDARAGRPDDPLRDRRRAGSDVLRAAAGSLPAGRGASSGACIPGCVVHAANSAATLGSHREAHFDMARCGIAIYGMDPSGDGPARARPGARAVAALVRRGREAGAAGRHRRLRAHLDGARRRRTSPCCRSDTATATGAACRTRRTC